MRARPPPRLDVYVPYRQSSWRLNHLMVRTDGDAAAVAASVRRQIRAVDPRVHGVEAATIEQLVSFSLPKPRFIAILLGLFGLLAVTLGAVGIYGVLSYMVEQRTGEIGVRVALGAAPGHVVRLVVAQGMSAAMVGTLLGLAGALALTRVLQSLLYQVSATDPLTFMVVPAGVLAVALLASYLPARRATRIDPLVALRSE